MSYRHLSTFERGRIEELISLGLSNRMIAKRLGRHRSKIDRKLRRNTTRADYHSEFAQMSYHQHRWIDNGSLHAVDIQVLRHKGKRRKADERSQFSMGMPISERPKEVAHRQVFGHWELDTMVSSRGKSRGCVATFVERKSRLYTALHSA